MIRDTLRKVLDLNPATVMEYKSNNGESSDGVSFLEVMKLFLVDSMQDKSSFRNSAIDRTPFT